VKDRVRGPVTLPIEMHGKILRLIKGKKKIVHVCWKEIKPIYTKKTETH